MLTHPPDAAALVTYVLVFAAVCVVTRRRPAYGIAALVLFVPFAFYRDVGGTTLTFPKVALLGALSGLGLRRADVRILGAPAVRTLLICAGCVFAATALSLAHAAFRGAALRETLKAAEYGLLFATVAVAARADPDDAVLEFAFSLGIVAVSALALAQEFTGAPSALGPPLHPIPRIAGPLEGPNQLSAYLGIALCVVGAFLARDSTRFGRVALCLGSAALTLTFSRAGILTAIVGLVLVFKLSPERTARGLPVLTVAGAIVGLILFGAGRLVAEHSGSLAGLFSIPFAHVSSLGEAQSPGSVGTRSRLWHAALVLWRAHPVFGIGAGNFELELANAGYRGVRTHANSLYLQSLVEGGIPLFAATLALVGASVWRFARGPFTQPFVVAALAASSLFALHQFVDLLVFYPKVGELWWIVLALGAARSDARAPHKQPA